MLKRLSLLILTVIIAAWTHGVVVAPPPSGTTVQWFTNDMIYGSEIQFLDPSTGTNGTMWLTWATERTLDGTTTKWAECATLNLDTNVYNGPYICGQDINPYGVSDVHGDPAAIMDASGCVYNFVGGIASSQFVTSTTTPRDPSSWTQRTNFRGVNGYSSFPKPRRVGSDIWIFNTGGTGFFTADVASETTQELVKMNTSGCVPSYGTAKTYIDTSANGIWNFVATVQIYGTVGYAGTVAYDVLNGIIGNVYFYKIDTATGNLSNFDGTSVFTPGSQPINYATLNADFRVIDNLDSGIYNSPPNIWYDGPNNTAHILYAQGTCLDGTCPVTLQYINLTISAGHTVVSSPLTIYTWPTGSHVTYAGFQISPLPAGGITAIIPDSTYAPGAAFNQGNLVILNRSSGGVWDTVPTLMQARTSIAFSNGLSNQSTTGAVAPPQAQLQTTEHVIGVAPYGNVHAYLRKDIATPLPVTLPSPTVSAVSPGSGGAGTFVTITGTGLGFPSAIKFGALDAASYSCMSPTSCVAYSPVAAAGTVDVQVTTPAGTSPTSSADHFTNNSVTPTPQPVPAPAATINSPNQGVATGGTPVVITGYNFTGATAVHFCSNSALFSVDGDATIYAISPAGSGACDVTVTTPTGTSNPQVFTYFTPTQMYWNASTGNDSNDCLAATTGGGHGPCLTWTHANAMTFSGNVQINSTGTWTTGACPVFYTNVAFQASVLLNGGGTTTLTPNTSDPTCFMATGAEQTWGAVSIYAESVTITGWTIHGNGGHTMFGIFGGGQNSTAANNIVDGFYCLGPPSCNFWGSDINISASGPWNIIDNATIGQSGVGSFDDTGIRMYNSNPFLSVISGNTVANIGAGPECQTGGHPSCGSGLQNNFGESFQTWQYNVSHDIGWNALGGTSAFLVGSDYGVVRRNEGYNTRPAFSSLGDHDGFDCADEGVGPYGVCTENYSHGNYRAGFLYYIASHLPFVWTNNTIKYSISENDAQGIIDQTFGAIDIGGGGACSSLGCCGEVGTADVYNVTVYMDPSASMYHGGPVAAANDECQGSAGVFANNLLVRTKGTEGGGLNFSSFFYSQSLPMSYRTFTGNGYFAINGFPEWYQVNGGTYGNLSDWQASVPPYNDMGAILVTGTDPLSGTPPAGTCTWTPTSTGPGPQGFSSCPSLYELGGGSAALGAGAALNQPPFNLTSQFISPAPGVVAQKTLGGIGAVDYYNNSNNVGVVTKPHCIGAFDSACGTNSTPPTVVVTAPGAGTISGTLNLTASCAAASGFCQSVTFTVGGIPAYTPTAAPLSPYTASWDTTSLIDGTYSIVASGTDSSGNVGTSAPVSVTINNGAVLCSQATALLGRGYTGNAYNATRLLCKGFAQGYASLIDVGNLIVGNDQASGLMNAYQNAYNGTINTSAGGISFAANGVSSFYGGDIDTHFNPTTASMPNFTLNSASLHNFVLPNPDLPANGAGFDSSIGIVIGNSLGNPFVSTNSTYLYPQYSDGNFYGKLTDATGGQGVAVSSPFGFSSVVRSNSAGVNLYRSANLLLTNSGVSGTMQNVSMRISPAYFSLNTGVAIIGGSMTQTQVSALCRDVTIFVWAQTAGKTIGAACN